ncbi:right-handed parallel beta-helix repeat-containing protein [Nitrolancea hollandica]|uniref:Right handed beta helix domain-containing protein n=1 Tax=Nitrolancea hollandica Lb TaxID=1129897 RepID=I4EL40_9BACT|nr:right-handed parallel beta-helix repeat-containing protein [Nitrolancea hollandica]CCF85402.1 conserved hypothetical protein [Nitrolancea hollandica Lb]
MSIGLGLSWWISGPVAPTIYLQPGQTIQQGIDGATTGAILSVPAGLYREQVTVTKPLTLQGQPGAEIRGSEVWASWTAGSGIWTSTLTVPNLGSDTQHGDPKTQWREQVFLDGAPLTQVAVGTTPVSGQFALDASRHVILADNPAGKTVEVTARSYWVVSGAHNVTVQGFTMKHAGCPAQDGGIRVNGHNGWTIQRNTLSDAHGRCVSFGTASGCRVLNNDIGYGGCLGIGGWQLTNSIISGNRIHHCNTEGFDTAWEAGGIKLSGSSSVTISGNEVDHNTAHGIWCDIACDVMVISGNRVHDNTRHGIRYEVSSGAEIASNVVWNNGFDGSTWGWGAGIVIQNSNHCTVHDNVVAWCADGIVVFSQNRGDTPAEGVIDNNLYANDILIADDTGPDSVYVMGWLQDWAGTLFDPASNNRGSGNRFYIGNQVGNDPNDFSWNGSWHTLAQFSTTPVGAGSSYLTATEVDQILSDNNIPTS